mmetsp:Transcript_25661/g.60737  ORF Transcript_25661/g.60737 Transcript_25661/m.60737 type:complete len:206 (-) Transcript_25661:483-1100(-)
MSLAAASSIRYCMIVISRDAFGNEAILHTVLMFLDPYYLIGSLRRVVAKIWSRCRAWMYFSRTHPSIRRKVSQTVTHCVPRCVITVMVNRVRYPHPTQGTTISNEVYLWIYHIGKWNDTNMNEFFCIISVRVSSMNHWNGTRVMCDEVLHRICLKVANLLIIRVYIYQHPIHRKKDKMRHIVQSLFGHSIKTYQTSTTTHQKVTR